MVADIMAKVDTRENSYWRELMEPLHGCEDAFLDDKIGLPVSRWTNTED